MENSTEKKIYNSREEWWRDNRERILAEDSLNHELDMKRYIAKDPDTFLEQFEQE